MPHGGVEHLLMQRRQSRENAVRSYASGGSVQATAQKLQGMGRNGDTILAHINPEEAALLKRMGGSGKINPNTGLISFEPGFGSYGPGATGNYGGGPEKDRDRQGPGNAGVSNNVDRDRQGPGNAGTSGNVDRDRQGPGNVGKTDTSGGPGSAPGGDGSSSGSQGPGAGTGSMPSGGITTIPTKDLPVEKATPVKDESPNAKALVDKVAKRYGLEPKFFGAWISQEGSLQLYPPTGSAGEEGPGQVKPSTFADPGYGVVPGTGDITDPETNLDFAARYLIGRFTHTTGKTVADLNTRENQEIALKLYNSGKNAEAYVGHVFDKYHDPNSAYNKASFTIPDSQAALTPTDSLKALSAPTEKNLWEKAVDDAPGYAGTALVSSMFPPLGMLNLAAEGVNFLTGKKTVPTLPGIINDAVRGTGTAAPTENTIIGGYGPSGGKITNTDPVGFGPYGNLTREEYQKQYGGSDKPLLGIESLDRSPLLPEIDPSVPTAPLFDFDYSKFGIKGEPVTEYDYSNFGIKGA